MIGAVVVNAQGDGTLMTVVDADARGGWLRCQWFEGSSLRERWVARSQVLVVAGSYLSQGLP